MATSVYGTAVCPQARFHHTYGVHVDLKLAPQSTIKQTDKIEHPSRTANTQSTIICITVSHSSFISVPLSVHILILLQYTFTTRLVEQCCGEKVICKIWEKTKMSNQKNEN